MATTLEQILGTQQTSSPTPTVTQQTGQQQTVQTGANVVAQPTVNANQAKTETTSVQTEAAKKQEATQPQQSGMSYVQMFQQMNPYKPPTAEQLEAERKRNKRSAIFAAIGDGISALSNLYFTTKGAPNMYNPQNAMTGKLQAKWEKTRAERKADLDKYMSGYMQAMKMDDDKGWRNKQWDHQLEREGVADKKDAERFQFQKDEAQKGHEQWQKQFDASNDHWNKDYEFKQKSFNESVRQFNVTSSQNAQRINMEAKRLNHELQNNGGVTFTLGKGNGNITLTKDKLNAQTVSYIFNQLPESVKANVHGAEIMTMQYGQKVGTGQYEPPTTEAMLVAIGMHAEDGNVGAALKEVAGKKQKKGTGYGDDNKGY